MTPLMPARPARSLPRDLEEDAGDEGDHAGERGSRARLARWSACVRRRDLRVANAPVRAARLDCPVRPPPRPATFLTRLMTMMPHSQTMTIAIEAGLTGPIVTDDLSSAPIRTSETTRMTSSASSTGMSEPTR